MKRYIFLLFVFLSINMYSQSERMYDSKLAYLDSLIENKDSIYINEPHLLVFLRFMNELDKRCLDGKSIPLFGVYKLNKSKACSLSKYLHDNRSLLIEKIELTRKKLGKVKYKRLEFGRQKNFWALYYLDESLVSYDFDFDSMCSHYMKEIRKRRSNNINRNDREENYRFLMVVSLTEDSFEWDVHSGWISVNELDNVKEWYIQNRENKTVHDSLFDNIGKWALFNEYYIDIL